MDEETATIGAYTESSSIRGFSAGLPREVSMSHFTTPTFTLPPVASAGPQYKQNDREASLVLPSPPRIFAAYKEHQQPVQEVSVPSKYHMPVESCIPEHRKIQPKPQMQSFGRSSQSTTAHPRMGYSVPPSHNSVESVSNAVSRDISKDSDLLHPMFSELGRNEPDGPWNGRYGNRIAIAYDSICRGGITDGKTVPNPTGKDIIVAVQEGRVMLAQAPDGFLETVPAAMRRLSPSVFQYNGHPETSPARTLDLGTKIKLSVKRQFRFGYDSDKEVEPAERSSGPTEFMPPPGYVRIAAEHGLTMTWYNTQGVYNRVYSWAVPPQIALSQLGGLAMTIIELGSVCMLLYNSH